MEQRDFLRKQMLKKTREQINEKMAGKEIHIIKAINLLSDLDSINNLMNENASEWKTRQPTGEAEEAFRVLEKNTESIAQEKEELIKFIEKEMNTEFPNFSTLATPIIGAKLLASAGSKKRLCMMPASTIQVLGAEKALFAHLKKNAKSPKHGHLFNHPLLQNLPRFKRGTAARIIAGKLSIALKQDYFNGENTSKEVLAEIIKKIDELATKAATPKQEEHEKNFDQINADRRKEEFLKTSRKREFRQEGFRNKPNTEEDTYAPQERKPFNRGFAPRREGGFRPRTSGFGGRDRPRFESGFNRGPRREGPFTPRRDGEGSFGAQGRGEATYGAYHPQRRSFEGNFTPRRDGQFNSDYRTREKGNYEQRGEHTFRPNRNERSFGGERRENSFGKSSDSNRYAKAKFHGKKFGKAKFVKRY